VTRKWRFICKVVLGRGFPLTHFKKRCILCLEGYILEVQFCRIFSFSTCVVVHIVTTIYHNCSAPCLVQHIDLGNAFYVGAIKSSAYLVIINSRQVSETVPLGGKSWFLFLEQVISTEYTLSFKSLWSTGFVPKVMKYIFLPLSYWSQPVLTSWVRWGGPLSS